MANMVNMTNIEHGKRTVDGRTNRFVVMLTRGELEGISKYRHAHRIGSQGEAMRRLMKVGLEKEMAATGIEFGDQAPAAAGNITVQEIGNAEER